MIDLHCHILPNVDDGPSTIEESIEMARKALSEGIRTIIATPHHKNGAFENPKDKIIKNVDKLNRRLAAEGIDIKVLPGQETRICGEIVEALNRDEISTLNGSPYLFIEFPSDHIPNYTGQILFELLMNGIKPIIVHPERNKEIIEYSDSLYHLVKNGALVQLTASSITGDYGKKIQRFSFDLIEAGMAHVVASDAHNTSTRTFKLGDAYQLIEKKFGTDARFYFQENAQLVVNNQTIFAGPPVRITKKKFMGLF